MKTWIAIAALATIVLATLYFDRPAALAKPAKSINHIAEVTKMVQSGPSAPLTRMSDEIIWSVPVASAPVRTITDATMTESGYVVTFHETVTVERKARVLVPVK
jgi:hypothetical protein